MDANKIKKLNAMGFNHLVQLMYQPNIEEVFKKVGFNSDEVLDITRALQRVP
jgi:hypothetical protein